MDACADEYRRQVKNCDQGALPFIPQTHREIFMGLQHDKINHKIQSQS